jgi:hypothetical protein
MCVVKSKVAGGEENSLRKYLTNRYGYAILHKPKGTSEKRTLEWNLDN